MTRLLLADDQSLIRLGFRMILEREPGLTIVGEAADGTQAVALSRELRPDVVLMDVRMPGLDGIAATQAITAAGLPSRVLILTTFDLDEYVYAGLRAGASGFLLKDAPPATLIAAIKDVAAGDAVIAPTATRRLLDEFVRRPGYDAVESPELASLTAREREVLMLLAEGLSNQEIATRLFLVEATVKTHVGKVLAKLGVRDRVQAVIVAYENGLVVAGDRKSSGT
jgi:DNA-binding NarL/FixJ family response regulator